MLVCLWSVKGGAGTTVVAAGLGIRQSMGDDHGVLLVDLAGDLAAVLGVAEPDGAGIVDWAMASADVPADALVRLETPVEPGLSLLHRGGERDQRPDAERCRTLARLLAGGARSVIVDCGRFDDIAGSDGDPLVAALLAQASRSILVTRPCYLALRRARDAPRPTEVVLVRDEGRAFTTSDIEGVVGAPIAAVVPWDPAIARAVDSGLLTRRMPRTLSRAARGLS